MHNWNWIQTDRLISQTSDVVFIFKSDKPLVIQIKLIVSYIVCMCSIYCFMVLYYDECDVKNLGTSALCVTIAIFCFAFDNCNNQLFQYKLWLVLYDLTLIFCTIHPQLFIFYHTALLYIFKDNMELNNRTAFLELGCEPNASRQVFCVATVF